jgi:hypothetical protein
LVLFITFPLLIRLQLPFYTALGAAVILMVITYFMAINVLEKYGINL